MKDTCRGESCWFYILMKELVSDSSKLKIEDCPFYQEMIWTSTSVNGKNEAAEVIKDCVNKRSFLVLLEDVYPRLLGVQKSNEEMRNATQQASTIVSDILQVVTTKQINRLSSEIPQKVLKEGG